MVQGIERRDQSLILYDCGGFIDDIPPGLYVRNEWSFVFLIDIGADGIRGLQLIPMRIDKCAIHLALGKEFDAICKRMKRLSAALGTTLSATDGGLALAFSPAADVPPILGWGHSTATAELRIGDGVRLFPIDDFGLVFSEPAQEFYILNDLAIRAWQGIADGTDNGEIVGDLARALATGRSAAEQFFTSVCDQWRQLGLVEENRPGARKPAASSVPVHKPRVRREKRRMPADGIRTAIRHYQLLDTVFELRCESADQMDAVHPVLANLECRTMKDADSRVDITSEAGQQVIYRNGRALIPYPDVDWLPHPVRTLMLEQAVQRSQSVLALAASVVSDRREGTLLLSQKETAHVALAAALTRSGFRGVSAETTALSTAGHMARSMALSMELPSSAWDRLAAFLPELATGRRYRRRDGEALQYADVFPGSPASRSNGSCPIANLVLFQETEGGAGSIKPLERVTAIGQILGGSASMPRLVTLAEAEGLVRWLRQLDCFRLSAGSLTEAVAVFKDQFHQR